MYGLGLHSGRGGGANELGEGHVNIITMRELVLTRTHLGLVMGYASGEGGGPR